MSEEEEKQEGEGLEQEVEKTPEIDPKIEERAKLQGWTPKESFRGDPERWITAKEFVDRADNMMPILKSVNKKYEEKLIALEKELKDQKELTKKMIKIHGKYSKETYDSKVAEIKLKKQQAVEDGDVELYKTLDDQQEKITAPEVVEIEEDTKQQDHPEVARWKEENSKWYGQDQELTEYADIIADRMARKGHSYKEYEFCNSVKEKVMKMFPDKFKNPAASKGSGVDEPGTRGTDTGKGKKKGWGDLDADAKAQCAELVATVPGYTKEKYLKDYYEEA
jgi:protein required for attachment to host cells